MEKKYYEVLIRESHLDTFGHVNNAVYLKLFEEARWDYITARGYGLSDILAKGLGPVILEATVKFKKELRLRERIRIDTECTGYRKLIGTIRQNIYNDKDEICASANFVFGLFDLVGRKLVPPTPEWLAALDFKP